MAVPWWLSLVAMVVAMVAVAMLLSRFHILRKQMPLLSFPRTNLKGELDRSIFPKLPLISSSFDMAFMEVELVLHSMVLGDNEAIGMFIKRLCNFTTGLHTCQLSHF